MTLVIAHRGASAYELENTLAAFQAARAMGADGVELDMHTTADGVPLVHHDPRVGQLAIAAVPLVALADHRLENGEAVPTLQDALETLGAGLEVFVEVKGLPAEHDRRLFEVINGAPAPARVHIHGFDHRIVSRLKSARPALTCGVLSCSYPLRPYAPLEDAHAVELWQEDRLVDGELIRGAHHRGLRVYAWTVDDPHRMRALVELGVDGVCTNRPDVARETVR